MVVKLTLDLMFMCPFVTVQHMHHLMISRLKSVGKARPPGVEKYRITTVSELAESSGEFPDVVETVGEALPPGVAK